MTLKLNDVNFFGPVISSSCKNIEEALMLIDYFYSPSGSELSTLGAEGVTYEKDADGNITYPGLDADDTPSITLLQKTYGLFNAGTYTRMHPDSIYFDFGEKIQEATDLMVDNDRIAPLDPILIFNKQEIEDKAEIETNLLKAMEEYVSRVIYGMDSIDNWDTWLEKAEQLGYKELEGIYAAAYVRYLTD